MFNQTFSSIRLGEKEIRANFDCFAKLWCQGDSQASQKIDFFSNVFGEPDLLLFLHYILCLLGTVHILATPPSISMVLHLWDIIHHLDSLDFMSWQVALHTAVVPVWGFFGVNYSKEHSLEVPRGDRGFSCQVGHGDGGWKSRRRSWLK